jgi:PAS domain S-box-containing protein
MHAEKLPLNPTLLKAERHIEAQASFISKIIAASPDIISVIDILSGTTVYINRMLLTELGYNTQDIRERQLEKNLKSLCHRDDLLKWLQFDSDIRNCGDEVPEFEARLKTKAGAWQWFRFRGSVLQRDENGQVQKYLSFIQNITLTKSAEEDEKKYTLLKELNKSKNQFYSDMSHELRTPIALILGQVEELKQAKSGLDSKQHDQLEMIRRNTLRIKKLADTQVDVAAFEEKRFQIVYQRVNISELTRGLASNFTSLIENAGLRFNVSCDLIKDPIYLNLDAWEKVVFNLLSNALKYTFKGKIEVILKENRNHVQLQVKDTGVGISQENLPKLFKRFERFEPSNARSSEGNGIGLALVKDLVAYHGGFIKVSSVVGKGTRFIITIPKGKSHLPPKQIFESSVPVMEDSSNAFLEYASSWIDPDKPRKRRLRKPSDRIKTVLVVDDNVDMRKYLEQILRDEYDVLSSPNASHALDLIDEGHKIDLVISDVRMPGTDGIALTKAIRERASTREIPVLLLTAHDDEDSRLQALEQWADDYLVKPLSKEVLLNRVDLFMRRTRSF